MVEIKTEYVLEGPPVAANDNDHKLLVMGSHIVVITDQGKVFAHDLPRTSRTIGEAYPVLGFENVAANDQDWWVVAISDSMIGVITKDGHLFSHGVDWSPPTVRPHFAWKQPGQDTLIGRNYPEDWWVMETTPGSLAVGRRDGGVFVHPLNTPASGAVGPARHINPHGPAVGSNPQDRFVVYMVRYIWIITTSGGVYAHKYGLKSFPYREVDAAFRVSGDVEPVDGSGPFVLGTMLGTKIRFAAAQENRLLLFRKNGEVVGYEFDGLPSGASA